MNGWWQFSPGHQNLGKDEAILTGRIFQMGGVVQPPTRICGPWVGPAKRVFPRQNGLALCSLEDGRFESRPRS